jgi:hypothetical protein
MSLKKLYPSISNGGVLIIDDFEAGYNYFFLKKLSSLEFENYLTDANILYIF